MGICYSLGRLHQKDVSLEKTEKEEHFCSLKEQLEKAQNWGWETWVQCRHQHCRCKAGDSDSPEQFFRSSVKS